MRVCSLTISGRCVTQDRMDILFDAILVAAASFLDIHTSILHHSSFPLPFTIFFIVIQPEAASKCVVSCRLEAFFVPLSFQPGIHGVGCSALCAQSLNEHHHHDHEDPGGTRCKSAPQQKGPDQRCHGNRLLWFGVVPCRFVVSFAWCI